MSIELRCPSCNQLLRVADHHAGQQARCPKCKTVFPVPGEAPFPEQPSVSQGPTALGQTTGTSHKWYLKTAKGQQFGPVDKAVLDSWVTDGRITADCQLLQEGSSQWQWASDVYSQLGYSPQPLAASSAVANSGAGNPYVSPTRVGISTHARSEHTLPDRGAVILTLGILGLVICPFLGLPAWIMGQSDLNDMRYGRMDPTGRGMTQAGMILGIISTCFLGLGCCFFFLGALAGG